MKLFINNRDKSKLLKNKGFLLCIFRFISFVSHVKG